MRTVARRPGCASVRLWLFVGERLFRRLADQQGNTTSVLTNQIKSWTATAGAGSSLSARLQSAGSPSPDANVGALLRLRARLLRVRAGRPASLLAPWATRSRGANHAEEILLCQSTRRRTRCDIIATRKAQCGKSCRPIRRLRA